MTKFLGPFLTSILFLAALVGCSGSGNGSFDLSSAAGLYGGGFRSTDGTQSGHMNVTLNATGDASGTIHNDVTDENGTISGCVTNNGAISLTANYGGSTTTITGDVAAESNSNLTGNYVETGTAGSVQSSFTLVKGVNAPGAGGGQYAGTYSGAIAITGNANAADVTISIGANGNISGSIVNNATGRRGAFVGSVSGAGAYTLNINYETLSSTATGTFGASGGSTLTGDFVEAALATGLNGTLSFARP